MYYQRYDVSNYSGAMKFASEVFHYLNGKVNYMIPANCLIFGHSNMGACYGDTTLDIVEINIPNISNISRQDGLNESKFRGLIFYTILHELLHIDQDTGLYDAMFSNLNKKDVTEILEQSCHAMTIKVFQDILDNSFFYDFDIEDIAVPSSEIFMNIPMTETDKVEQWVNSYYRVKNVAEKALYFLGTYLDIDFLATAIEYQASNILLEVKMNGKPIGCDYVYYLNQWMVSRIFNLLRPIAFLTKAKSNTTPLQVISEAKTYVDENNNKNGYIILSADVRTPYQLQVVNQSLNHQLLY